MGGRFSGETEPIKRIGAAKSSRRSDLEARAG